MIRLQFSTSLEWQSAIIRRISHSPFSHVDAIPPEGGCLGASNSEHAPCLKGNPGGVALRPSEYQPFGIRRIAELRAPAAVEAKFWGLLDSQLGKPFDNDALYTFLSPDVSVERDWREAKAWFCSELVTWALEQAGLWSYPLLIGKNRVNPADLLLLVSPHVVNGDTFWQPVPGLRLGKEEK